jgi:hypothetical protein
LINSIVSVERPLAEAIGVIAWFLSVKQAALEITGRLLHLLQVYPGCPSLM